ncbi:HEAT repeat domain-containing protein [Nannocystis pusilla]|uniref:HEAT repeat domain-containing protein n=1 Tax=Nannocystis pusilla TaxID=889268 RepID=UPI003B7AAED5
MIDKQLRCAEAPWSGESLRRPAAEVGVQVSTTLAVQPPDRAALGSVIDELGRQTLSADDTVWREAEQALATVEDSRVVSHYVRLLQHTGERPFLALQRLCRHGTDEALHALGEALASPAYRSYEVVLGLGANPHPGALELLWSFRRDEAANIRLAVLQGVFQRRPADCRERMRRFLDDPEASVREEARRLVAELAG